MSRRSGRSKAIPQEGPFPLFTRVVKKGGNRTIRVLVRDAAELERLKTGVVELGCSFEGAFSKLIAVDIPAAISLERVRDYLIEGGFRWEHADPTSEEYEASSQKEQ